MACQREEIIYGLTYYYNETECEIDCSPHLANVTTFRPVKPPKIKVGPLDYTSISKYFDAWETTTGIATYDLPGRAGAPAPETPNGVKLMRFSLERPGGYRSHQSLLDPLVLSPDLPQKKIAAIQAHLPDGKRNGEAIPIFLAEGKNKKTKRWFFCGSYRPLTVEDWGAQSRHQTPSGIYKIDLELDATATNLFLTDGVAPEGSSNAWEQRGKVQPSAEALKKPSLARALTKSHGDAVTAITELQLLQVEGTGPVVPPHPEGMPEEEEPPRDHEREEDEDQTSGPNKRPRHMPSLQQAL